MQPGVASPYPDADPSASILNCLPDGFVARIVDQPYAERTSPVFADGHWWWYLLGQGWVAEDWLAFHHEGSIPYPSRPELGGQGLIAYIGTDGNVWTMSADGGGQRLLAARRSDNEHFSKLIWSPNGDRLAFATNAWDQAGGYSVSTRVVNPAGTLLAEYPGLAEAVWSPPGTHLSALRVSSSGEMGGYRGTPVVVDLATGSEWSVGPLNFYLNAPVWSPDGGRLAFTCQSGSFQEYLPDGATKDIVIQCPADGLIVIAGDGALVGVALAFTGSSGSSYGNPSWSPGGQTISLSAYSSDGTGCRGYALVDVNAHTVSSCLPLPPPGGAAGRCGGDSEVGATDWSRDGRYLAYHTMFGAGENGAFIVYVAAGVTRLIPGNGVSHVSFSYGGSHITFGNSGYIWVADTDGSGLAVLAQGATPAWQPLP
jgi:Tol biopolymer transport system component